MPCGITLLVGADFDVDADWIRADTWQPLVGRAAGAEDPAQRPARGPHHGPRQDTWHDLGVSGAEREPLDGHHVVSGTPLWISGARMMGPNPNSLFLGFQL